jgi:hypothetical protein
VGIIERRLENAKLFSHQKDSVLEREKSGENINKEIGNRNMQGELFVLEKYIG